MITKIIDTHQHLWDLERFPYSWTAKQPRLQRSFRMNDYLEAAGDFELIKSVHVEADIDESFMEAETEAVLELAEREDNPLAGVVAAARPEADDFHERLRQVAGHPLAKGRLKGVRRLLHTQPDELSTTARFIDHVRSLEDYDLSFDICVLARQLPQAINLVKRCPKISFILDHCGNPDLKSRDERSWHAWCEGIVEIANFPNLVCKVSGIVVNTEIESWSVEDLRPAVEHIIDCFGWDRVLFGSDWPVCTLAASFKEWVEALNFLTKDAGERERRQLFRENAERVYRLS